MKKSYLKYKLTFTGDMEFQETSKVYFLLFVLDPSCKLKLELNLASLTLVIYIAAAVVGLENNTAKFINC